MGAAVDVVGLQIDAYPPGLLEELLRGQASKRGSFSASIAKAGWRAANSVAGPIPVSGLQGR
jgi:hypothetical protein